MMGALQNQMRLQALMATQLLSPPRVGLVTSYDPDNYLVKVALQPSGTETGWIPIVTMMAGNGFGIYAGPSKDDQALVVFQEGSIEVGMCLGFLPSTVDQPPHVAAGTVLARTADGSFITLRNDGSVLITAGSGGSMVLANAGLTVTGWIKATADITDNSGSNTASMRTHRAAYDTHVHPGVQSGTSSTAPTTSTV